jgi:hypothetical protein
MVSYSFIRLQRVDVELRCRLEVSDLRAGLIWAVLYLSYYCGAVLEGFFLTAIQSFGE